MDQPFDAVVNACEGAELGQLGDGALDDVADLVALLHQGPGIGLRLLQGERDLLGLGIDAQDVDLHLVADVEHLAGMIDPTV